MFDEGLKVSSIGVMRSALSDTLGNFDGVKLGQHPIVGKLIDSMHYLRPAKVKEAPKWNVDTVLGNVSTWGANSSMEMEKLTLKLVMLFALSTGARCNELADLRTNLAFRSKNGIRFRLDKHKKQRKASIYPGYIDVPTLPDNILMCPVTCFDWYTIRTTGYSINESDDFLFRALSHPHGKVTTSTISRWISKCIELAGGSLENSSIAHSVRGMAATKAKYHGFTTKQIMQAVEWNSDSVFYDYYYNQEFDPNFGRCVLTKHEG